MNGAGSDRPAMAGIIIACLASVVLGVQAKQAEEAVLRSAPIAAPAGSPANAGKALLAQIVGRNAALGAASVSNRDPFRDPPPPPAPPSRVRTVHVDSTATPTPSACGLIFDTQDPRVKLSAGADTSPWLRKGESFQGWLVVEISRKAITISRNGETVVLNSP